MIFCSSFIHSVWSRYTGGPCVREECVTGMAELMGLITADNGKKVEVLTSDNDLALNSVGTVGSHISAPGF
jgi:hypothetical protein